MGDLFANPISMPVKLDNTLTIGWQDRHYGNSADPKSEVAEKLFNIIDNSTYLKECIQDEAENNIASDLYDYNESDDEEPVQFTPYSGYYSTGQGDMVYAVQGEQPDYTACDSECGYCGRCQYY